MILLGPTTASRACQHSESLKYAIEYDLSMNKFAAVPFELRKNNR